MPTATATPSASQSCRGCHYGPPTPNNLCLYCSRYPFTVKEWQGPEAPNVGPRKIEGDKFSPNTTYCLQACCARLYPASPWVVNDVLRQDADVCFDFACLDERKDVHETTGLIRLVRRGTISVLLPLVEQAVTTASAVLAAHEEKWNNGFRAE